MPLGPLLVAIGAVVVVCAGAIVFLATSVPLAALTRKAEARIVACKVEEHKVPFPTEAGFAQVTLEVINASSQDRSYVVGVVVKDVGGQVVGTAEHRVGVPARHSREEKWRVILTKQGGRDCEVSKMVESV